MNHFVIFSTDRTFRVSSSAAQGRPVICFLACRLRDAPQLRATWARSRGNVERTHEYAKAWVLCCRGVFCMSVELSMPRQTFADATSQCYQCDPDRPAICFPLQRTAEGMLVGFAQSITPPDGLKDLLNLAAGTPDAMRLMVLGYGGTKQTCTMPQTSPSTSLLRCSGGLVGTKL